jgi:hypothetical protein
MIKSITRLFVKGVVKSTAVAVVVLGGYAFGREVGRYESNQKHSGSDQKPSLIGQGIADYKEKVIKQVGIVEEEKGD